VRTIVAGQNVTSEGEFTEAALGFVDFIPTAADFADYAAFVEDITDPSHSEIDAENALYLRRRMANVVPLPRRGTARLITSKEVRAA
jgi:hypothetical protein